MQNLNLRVVLKECLEVGKKRRSGIGVFSTELIAITIGSEAADPPPADLCIPVRVVGGIALRWQEQYVTAVLAEARHQSASGNLRHQVIKDNPPRLWVRSEVLDMESEAIHASLRRVVDFATCRFHVDPLEQVPFAVGKGGLLETLPRLFE